MIFLQKPAIYLDVYEMFQSYLGQCVPVVRVLGFRPRDPEIPRVQDTFWPLVQFVPSWGPWFNSVAAPVKSQLVCLRPVGILNSCSIQCSGILATSFSLDTYLLTICCRLKSRRYRCREDTLPWQFCNFTCEL